MTGAVNSQLARWAVLVALEMICVAPEVKCNAYPCITMSSINFISLNINSIVIVMLR